MQGKQQIEPLWQVGLIGDPVAHSYSPRFQQAALDALGIPARYELWPTPPNELAARVASLLAPRCMGANITIPYKEAVLPLLDVVDPLAARIGAINTIVHRDKYLYGYNTDAAGLLLALLEQGVGTSSRMGGDTASMVGVLLAGTLSGEDTASMVGVPLAGTLDGGTGVSLKGYTAVLLGAGGAARGAAFALIAASIDRLIIVNRNMERAQRLAEDVQQGSHCQVFSLSDADFLIPHPSSLIINATPVGMYAADEQGRRREDAEQASPLPAEVLARFAADTFVFDLIYHPVQTQLLCQARILGMRAVNGLPMLLHQGALAFSLWTGQAAPLEVMRAALF